MDFKKKCEFQYVTITEAQWCPFRGKKGSHFTSIHVDTFSFSNHSCTYTSHLSMFILHPIIGTHTPGLNVLPVQILKSHLKDTHTVDTHKFELKRPMFIDSQLDFCLAPSEWQQPSGQQVFGSGDDWLVSDHKSSCQVSCPVPWVFVIVYPRVSLCEHPHPSLCCDAAPPSPVWWEQEESTVAFDIWSERKK